MSNKTRSAQANPTPASRREVELAKPIIQGGREYRPGEKDKPKLTERQIERLTASGHIAPRGAAKAATTQES